MRAWELAHKERRRAFYEESTETVRLCPENYCLAYKPADTWEPYPHEGATKGIRDRIEGAAQTCRLAGKGDGETLAALLALRLKTWKYTNAR